MPKQATSPKPIKHPVTRPHPVSLFFLRIKKFMPLISIAIIVGGTYLAVQFGKGYRPTTSGISGTGLLAANSFPPGAQVYLDGKLTTATDDTLSLPPKDYLVTIKKDGHIPWEKSLTLKQELVTQTNATLFKSIGSLTPLTLNGATNITPSPDGQKIAYVVASASAAAKNGLYVVDLANNSAINFQRTGPRQISRTTALFDLAQATLLWSPNSQDILVHSQNLTTAYNYLLSATSVNDIDALPDVTPRLSIILSEWEEDIVLRETKQFALLPEPIQQIATQSATNLYFSPNEEKLLYVATASATIPENLIARPTSPSTQAEDRILQPGHIYVYDLIQDKNYHFGEAILATSTQAKKFLTQDLYSSETNQDITATIAASLPSPLPITAYNKLQDPEDFSQTAAMFNKHYSSIHTLGFQWYPNSNHLLITYPNKIDIVEADATNWVTLYSGPFENNFVYPWPDGSKLIITTNLNPATSDASNLYTIDIR
jgi:hypothetical protein